MKLVKFEHSCFALEEEGQTLLFDPGSWSSDLALSDKVTVVVLTHQHSDHFDLPLLRSILTKNSAAVVIAPSEMKDILTGIPATFVTPGDVTTIGPFRLRFFGGTHAIIHPDIPSVTNLGVLVNDTFYNPGDSFVQPDVHVKILALPVTAPWLKVSEAIDFMIEIHPDIAFPIHDHIASDDGKALVDTIIGGFAEKNKIRYQRIIRSVEV